LFNLLLAPGYFLLLDIREETDPEYKKGAFLEKAERFNKLKLSDVSGRSAAELCHELVSVG
jgi:hypothetical protein